MASEASHGTARSDEPSGDAIDGVDLPGSVTAAVEAYEAAGGHRDRYLWQWIYDLLPTLTISSVPADRVETVRRLKTDLTILVTLLDDLAERDGDQATFRAIRRRVRWPEDAGGYPEAADRRLVSFAEDCWTRIDAALREAPRHDEYRAVFAYDLQQVLNAMDYSRVVNDTPAIATLRGARRYDSHNMVAFPYVDVDVMHSPEFDPADLGPTREVLWDLQAMARIGNWLTTWKREVREGDVCSGIVVYALQHGLVSPDDLDLGDRAGREELIDCIETYRVEETFEAEWRRLNRRVTDRDYETESVDLRALVDGMETVMAHHVAGQGKK